MLHLMGDSFAKYKTLRGLGGAVSEAWGEKMEM
jgi:hypothetical protein